ncbi:hypothetical protein AMATHDRAFT_68786 [Amanita thiersii Skay4041]|uniref:NAD-dependent epimerase/dehydratase domain-containing protein n=1 Tax=Amanita thiersii Skay4041 TaxID=703135 RepID=A0A2A9N8A3_9AGAR|nr:hypothetical protein AMATHDRAFT_68786 [Amanita thiersii Skay4041]
MPYVPKGSRILVTGANGFIAVWLVRSLLEQGYSVRGTVRSMAKGTYLTNMFKQYGDKFEIIIVEDLTIDGAFNDAVKGIDAIEHCASPVIFNADNPKDIIEPAVQGTLGILRSAKNAPQLKRIVILESIASIIRDADGPLVFSENDWNDQALDEVERLGRNASGLAKYRASKTLAERAAWDFHKECKNQVNWDLVTVNPPYVFGPAIHEVSSPGGLNASTKAWYDAVVARGESSKLPVIDGNSWVDVRDLGLGLVKSLEVKEAGGERIIVCGGRFFWQDWRNIAKSLAPSPILSPAPGTEQAIGDSDMRIYKITLDTSKEKRILGLTYRTKEEVTRDILADFERRGW